jgi:HK97 family phage portal protein
MAIFASGGALQTFTQMPMLPPAAAQAQRRYDTGAYHTYEQIYRRQPNVRTVIDFLARNIAQISFHGYRRVSDTDRQRLPPDHPLVKWLTKPNPSMTRYRLFESMVSDYCIYWAAYWLKIRDANGDLAALMRLPPTSVWPDGWLTPTQFVWTWPDGFQQGLAPSEVVYFGGYDPCNPILGLSPLETLRRTLAEEAAASEYRAAYWQNAARIEGVIERPASSPWTTERRDKFREQWQSRFASAPNAGMTPVLEDGMTYKPVSFSAKDSEYVDARKLTREECAAAYHVPLPMVGILEHATYSNIKEQHKQLYQDTLEPYCVQFEEELERQVVPECDDPDLIYIEANIAEKLKGSFEEQAAAIYQLTGRPVMTANESRARLNLPAMTNDETANQLARPLNYTSGGTALPPATGTDPGGARILPFGSGTAALASAQTVVIERAWARQRDRLAKLPVDARAAAFDLARWDRELADDLMVASRAAGADPEAAARAAVTMARQVNSDTLALLVAHEEAWSNREAGLYA